MGKVGANQTPTPAAAAAPPSSPVSHFTHPHPLQPLTHYNPQTLTCSGCKLRSSATMYTCHPCAFTLHQSCAKLPHLITHPSHPGCVLSLLVSAPYPTSVFSCDACARPGDAWSYHCARCDFDLHVTCAVRPMRIRHASHATCRLDLTFKSPYVHSDGFSCDVCGRMGKRQWLYRCGSCGFDVHLDCSSGVVPLRHQMSMPAPVHHQLSGGPTTPYLMHSASAGQMAPGNVVQPAGGGGFGSSMMMAAVQGLVEGVAQGVGQAVVQEVIGGGGGDFGDGGGVDAASY